jgi:hypothetical protein
MLAATLGILDAVPGCAEQLHRRPPVAEAHDGADLLRDALGQFICDICGQPCEDEPPDAGAEP